MVSDGCHQGEVKRSYAEVCNFPEQLLVVFFDRQVRVVFNNGADVCRRRFRKRDGHARAGGAACGSYCACVIVSLLLFLLCYRLVKGYTVVLVENSRVLDGTITLQFRQGDTLFEIVVPVVGLFLRWLQHKVERHRFTNLIRNQRFHVCGGQGAGFPSIECGDSRLGTTGSRRR